MKPATWTLAALLAAGVPTISAVAMEPMAQAAAPVVAAESVPPPVSISGQGAPWAKRIVGYLRASDGTLLRYSALLPKATGRFPVVINYSGYDPGAIGGKAYLEDSSAMAPNLDRALLENGYAVMGVNARGTGCSEGIFDFLGPKYGEDGRDAVEFAARQAWSNGAVGMANWSWAGMSQLATAAQRPPHLKAIAPGMVLGDARLDSWAPGGVPAPAFIAGWRIFLHERWDSVRISAEAEHDSRCLARVATNLAGEEEHAITHMVLRHPLRDSWIDARALSKVAPRIQVPVLSMEAFQDEAVTSREAYYQETLDPRKVWMVQTNGGHDLYESLRFRPILLEFLDRFVKGKDNGFDRRPHLEVWMDTTTTGKGPHAADEQSAPSWVFQRASIVNDPVPTTWSLAQGGTLASAPAGTPESYDYPVPGPSVDADFDRDVWGELPKAWRSGSLAFTGQPLERDMLAYGPGSADLYVSSSSSDADLQVTLTEVTPEGQEIFVQRGWLRLSDRAIDEQRSTALRPVLLDTPEAIRALTPEVPVLARVELNKLGYVFRKGSRIRIWMDTPSFWGGYGFSYTPIPAKIKIWHDAEHPSRLVIGELTGVDIPAGASGCSRLKEPCRPDPLAQ
jgi:hypothetical protein